jgi:hypothetical protein
MAYAVCKPHLVLGSAAVLMESALVCVSITDISQTGRLMLRFNLVQVVPASLLHKLEALGTVVRPSRQDEFVQGPAVVRPVTTAHFRQLVALMASGMSLHAVFTVSDASAVRLRPRTDVSMQDTGLWNQRSNCVAHDHACAVGQPASNCHASGDAGCYKCRD